MNSRDMNETSTPAAPFALSANPRRSPPPRTLVNVPTDSSSVSGRIR
ncbi:Uncharacterised protein [Mycobacteroides abscessus subsp. abscessus]|nr:Uncharacterised protein [Mycobacteroides abscessus subsp. abscessus]